MDRIVAPSTLCGVVAVPSSKSVAHRALICAAMCDSPTTLLGKLEGDDVIATAKCLLKLGAKFEAVDEYTTRVTPIDKILLKGVPFVELNVGESGSTLRFMVSVCAALGIPAHFEGAERLSERPMDELLDVLTEHGVYVLGNRLPFKIRGILSPGVFDIGASVSSQYASGLMMASPLASKNCTINISGLASSESYIDLTAIVMHEFGINILRQEDGGWFVSRNERYVSPGLLHVKGDWSNAAFFAVAGALAGDVYLDDIYEKSAQGDRCIVDLMRHAGCDIEFEDARLHVKKSKLHAIDFDSTNCPDLVPVAAVMCAASEGVSHIGGVKRLIYKESDRLKETIKLLSAFGIESETDGDVLTIYGGKLKGGAKIELPNDHRIAMAAAVAATVASGEPTTLVGSECVAKSYPDFFDDLAKLGGKVNVCGI